MSGALMSRTETHAMFPAVNFTKLGWGYGNVAFKFSDSRTIVLRVNPDGTFGVERVYWSNGMKLKKATALVQALVDLR